MDPPFIAQSRHDDAVAARNVNDASVRQARAPTETRTLDDDYACKQRNSPAPLDRKLIRAIADLDN
jgi:hypothetical protein